MNENTPATPTPAPKERPPLRTFRVEVRTQYAPGSERHFLTWGTFGRYEARSKAEAIGQAKRENERGGCIDGRTHGLAWWRAIEEKGEGNA